MSVDLNPIGFGISSGVSRNGFGSIVSFPSVSFLAYGTLISQSNITVYGDVGGVNTNIGDCIQYTKADGVGGTFTENSAVTYYSYGTQLRSDSGTYSVSLCGGYYNVGGYTNYWFADGNGSYYTSNTGSYSSYGTYLTSCNSQDHYSDGSGGYYSVANYPSYGTFLSTQNFTNNLSWSAPDGSSGTWTYSYGSYDVYADGNGGTYTSNSQGYTESYGTQIYSGMYYDEGQGMSVNFYIRFDGNSGCYTAY